MTGKMQRVAARNSDADEMDDYDRYVLGKLKKAIAYAKSPDAKWYTLEESRKLLHEKEQQWTGVA